MDIIACSRRWFNRYSEIGGYPLNKFKLISRPEDLTEKLIESERPEYVFFPHWGWKVGPEIYENVEAVVFHIAPLPKGRGGSPIQNLILQGYESAPVNALQMTGVLDAGPIYSSKEISLDGTLNSIFERATRVIWDQITWIRDQKPEPRPQEGEASYFRRLNPRDNEISVDDSFLTFWNKVRMVESDDYPDAYLSLRDSQLLLRNVQQVGDAVHGEFRLELLPRKDKQG